jgi:hypothetical protein
LGKAGG